MAGATSGQTWEILFMGTGTSVGIPMIGCGCPVCRSADPRDRRWRASLRLRTPEARWVVDTGPDFRAQCLRYGVTSLDAVLLTHAHVDHVAGFDDLRRFTVAEDAELPIHASADCLASVRRMFEYAFNGENRFPGYLKPRPMPFRGPFDLGGLEVVPLEVIHGRVPTHGFLFQRGGRKLLGYFPDVKRFPDATLRALEGVEVLVLDALRYTDHVTHQTFEEALAVVERLRPARAWFTHFQCEIGHAAAEEKLPPRVRLAYDGLTISLPFPV